MKSILAALALAASLGAHAAPLGYEGARHLLDRAGFGATDREIREYAALERVQAVDRLLEASRTEAVTAPPAFVHEAIERPGKLRDDPEARKALLRKLALQGLELRAWWLEEMLATPSPLTERMTLFWHNHFATSQRKVRAPQLMYRQNLLLRREALGNFATLLHAIAKDPAMLVYLDNARSRRGAPNENFAREVMELFTLGVGRYTEADVKEAARAFTGWSVDPASGAYLYRPFFHDGGEKAVLGRRGNLDGDQVLDILLARPETSRFIAAKLWREFVSPTPDPAEVERLAKVFRDARYEVKPLLRAILLSDAFWAPRNRATLVKSPVDVVVGTLRTFDIQPADLRPAAVACAMLGQNLFAPPNVKGWPGGDAWIDSATLLGRRQFVDRVFRSADRLPRALAMEKGQPMAPAQDEPGARFARLMQRGFDSYAFDDARWLSTLAPHESAADVDRLVLATAAVQALPATLPPAQRARALVADPAYQLK
jgi:uncharacterized protein (DUF1800 family)